MQKPGGKRLVNSKSGLKILCQHDKDTSPWELAEPQWVLDTEVNICTKCEVKFTFLNRRVSYTYKIYQSIKNYRYSSLIFSSTIAEDAERFFAKIVLHSKSICIEWHLLILLDSGNLILKIVNNLDSIL